MPDPGLLCTEACIACAACALRDACAFDPRDGAAACRQHAAAIDQNCATFYNRTVVDSDLAASPSRRCAGLYGHKRKVAVMGNHSILDWEIASPTRSTVSIILSAPQRLYPRASDQALRVLSDEIAEKT